MRQHHKIEQNEDEWYALRLGRFTASTFGQLFMGKSTAGYQKAIYGPVHERLTGESPESFYGEHMKRGHELEPFTVEQYEIDHFRRVEPGGFWTLGEWLGASPDGLVGEDGLIEGKAPAWNTMIAYLMKKGEVPKEYFWQVHGQMYVTDRAWVDFLIFHPDYPLSTLRVHRDEKIEEKLVKELEIAIEKAEEIFEMLSRREGSE